MNRVKKGFLISFCFVCSMALLSIPAYSITMSFNPLASIITVGDAIDVDIVISGMEELDDLSSFTLDANYDPAILSFNSYSLGPYLTNPFFGQDDWSFGDDGFGTVNLSELSWLMDFSAQPDEFTLATISFTGTALWTSTLIFANVLLGDYWGNALPVDNFGSGSIGVAPVPEPATMLLLGFGLIGLAGFKRKLQK